MARKQFSTSLEENLIKLLKLQAVEENRPYNEVLEQAIKEYLEKIKQ